MPDGSVAIASPDSGAIATYTAAEVQAIFESNRDVRMALDERGIVAFIADHPDKFRFRFNTERIRAMANGERTSLLVALELARAEVLNIHLELAYNGGGR